MVYLADNYHNNIKSIDVSNENLRVSEKVTEWVEDIAIVNDHLCLLYKDRKMLILDKNSLLIVDSLELPKGNKMFIEIDNEILIANTSNQQIKDSLVKIECYDLIMERKKEYRKKYLPNSNIKNRIGYSNFLQSNNEREYIVFDESYYEITNKIRPDNENGFYNIYIDGNTLLNYSQDHKKLYLRLLNY